jgi:hypothetical protein
MCHVASMTVMYVGLGTIQLSHHLSDGICVGLGMRTFNSNSHGICLKCLRLFSISAVTVHFAFLATFTWLNVLSFDIWWTFKYSTLFLNRMTLIR